MRKLILATSLLALSAGGVFAQTAPNATPIPDAPVETIPAEEVDFVFTEAPDDHVIGSDSAPITMMMYASVTCGHCGDWFQDDWPLVKRELIETGKIRFILRPLPTPPAILSVTGFLMAECAPDEDGYFSSIEYQMNNQEQILEGAQNGTAREEYAKVAEGVGLMNDEEINSCLSKESNMDYIRLNGKRAEAAEVGGVPAFYIGGEAYKGKQEGSAIVSLIETMHESGQSTLPENIEPASKAPQTETPHDHDH
ncbi:thioredoxin domain-containing protein [Litorimonas sp.]|jgi:protein-disulfide isomerase|uniref:thioredoxin domain-containing protein n=1 Tax=Litorimonas sp. TaxID=1892381 RepID=UPI003A8A80A4